MTFRAALIGVGCLFAACAAEPVTSVCPLNTMPCADGCCQLCVDRSDCDDDTGCCQGVCRATCDACFSDQTQCDDDGRCHDLDSDYDYCGDCETSCDTLLGTADTCRGGECACGDGVAPCTGELCCSGECVDQTTSGAHCGGCDLPCLAPRICLDGSCEDGGPDACLPLETCPIGPALQCTDTDTDVDHCGACGASCADSMPGRFDACLDGDCVCLANGTLPCDEGHTCTATGCIEVPCNSGTCPLGCCDGNLCREEVLESCGSAAGTCVDCTATLGARVDACVEGDCVCLATGAACAPDLTCTESECAEPTCDDGIENGDETGVDCGGSCTPCVQVFTLSNQTDINLATYLSAQGALTEVPLRILVPDGVIIGATGADAALTSGNLNAYQEVRLEISGEIQGAGGAANGGAGGNAIDLTAAIGVHITATGAVRGGGGGGGRGGNGGQGSDATSTWSYRAASVYGSDQVEVAWYHDPDLTNCGVRALDDNYRTYFDCGRWSTTLYDFDADQITRKEGYWRETVGGWPMYHFSIAFHGSHAGAAGGDGGTGQGWSQTRTDGDAGSPSVRRSGNGGTGGDGGDWGTSGSAGASGGTGYRYAYNNASVSAAGSAGGSGGAPGKAIECGSLTLPFQNDGTVSGALTCTTTALP